MLYRSPEGGDQQESQEEARADLQERPGAVGQQGVPTFPSALAGCLTGGGGISPLEGG